MIDQHSTDFTGWAQFSDDLQKRYRLARSFTPFSPEVERLQGSPRVVFVMLNPSTADAFKPDPTVSRCCEFARRWGADVLDVVNLFTVRSKTPSVLYDGARVAPGACGDFSHLWRHTIGCDHENDAAILDACLGAQRVIAAWGNHGELAGRGDQVAAMLVREGVKLEALRFSGSGQPMHPLARGKSFIPYDVVPEPWR